MAQLQSTSITGSLIVTGGITGSITGSIVAPGSTTQVLYNNGGVVAGSSGFVYSGSNVGIGTTTPTAPVDTNGVRLGRNWAIANRADIRLDSNGADYPADILFGHTAAANQTSWDGVYWSLSSRANNLNNAFTIWRGAGNPGGGGEEVLFTILPNGNVGIGTTSPTGKLTIVGQSSFDNGIVASSSTVNGTGLSLINSDTGGNAWHLISTATGNGGGAGNLGFYNETQGAYRVYFGSNGNVGIGTTNPSQKLDVAGNITATGYVNAGTGTDNAQIGPGYLSFYNAGSSPKYIKLSDDASTIDAIGFSKSGAVSTTWFPSGNVGIGTSSPATPLDVVSNSAATGITLRGRSSDNIGTFNFSDNAGNVSSQIQDRDGQFHITTLDTSPILFNTAASERMRIDASGNVGIGTTSPSEKLDVQGSINVSDTNFFRYKGNTGIIGSATSITGESGASDKLGIRSANDILFATNGANERLRITSAGNVGIGTTSPGQKLTLINGTFQIGGTSTFSDNIEIGRVGSDNNMAFATGGTERMRISSTGNVGIGTTTPGEKLNVFNLSNTEVAIRFGNSEDSSGYIKYINDDLQFITDYAVRIHIRDDGNVGIGTTSPGAKLHVVGNTYVQSGVLFVDTIAGYALAKVSLAASTDLIIPSGNVGIGTTSPVSKLHVVGEGDTVTLQKSNNVPALAFLGTSTNKSVIEGGDNFNFYTGGSSRVYITNAGNVGIGTTAPAYKLDVASLTTQIADFSSSLVDGLVNIRIYNSGQTTASGASPAAIELVGKSGSSTHGRHAWIGAEGVDGTTFRTQIKFKVRPEDSPYQWSTLPTQMVIDGNGNVGIGTTSPGARLDVNGPAAFGATTRTEIGDAGSTPTVDYGMFHNSGVGLGIASIAGGSTQGIQFWSHNGTSFFESLRIAGATGNVGIGTTSPGAKLVVSSASAETHISNGDTNTLALGGFLSGRHYIKSINLGVALTPLTLQASSFTFDTGNVGIGTTSPLAKLQVEGDGIVINTEGAAAAKYLYFRYSDGGDIRSDSYLKFSTSGSPTERMRIDASGNVGIGTTSPSYKLHVAGNGAFTGVAVTNPDTSGTFNRSSIDISSNQINMGFTAWGQGSVRAGTAWVQTINNYPLVFGTNDAEVMRLLTNGNVGIGTTAPETALHVIGEISVPSYIRLTAAGANNAFISESWGINLNGVTTHPVQVRGASFSVGYSLGAGTSYGTNSMFVAGNVGIGTTSPASLLHINGSGNTFTRYTNTTSAGHYIDIGANSAGESFVYGYGAYPLLFGTNGAERMRITSGGNVGIGTTAPQAKLEIGGAYEDSIILRDTRTSTTATYEHGIRFAHFNNYENGLYFQHNDFFGVGRDKFLLKVGNATRMVVDNGGNVGIGTTAPAAKLQVEGTTSFYNGAPTDGAINPGQVESISTGFNLAGSASIDISTIGVTTDKWKVLLTGGFANNFEGGGLVSPSLEIEVDYNSPTVAIGSTSITFSRNGTTGKLQVTNTNASYRATFVGTIKVINYPQSGLPVNSKIILGNVGIGTTAPGYKLQVNGTGYYSSQLTIDGFDNNQGLSFRKGYSPTNVGIRAKAITSANRDGLEILGYNGIDFSINNGATVAMRINGQGNTGNEGNVGIGTTSPTHKLDIFSTSSRISSANSSYTAWFIANTGTGNAGTYFDAINGDFSGNDYGFIGQNNTGFMEYTIGASSPAPYHVFSTGNVGIGTTAPNKKLTVIDNSTYQLRLASTNSAYSDAGIFLGSDVSDPFYYGTIKWNQSDQVLRMSSNSASGIGGITFETSPNTASPTERMRITSSGNVGINQTAPTHTLEVAGDTRTTTLRVDDIGGPPPQTPTSGPTLAYGPNINDYLTSPDTWLKININGADYVIPAFTPQ